MREVIFFLKIVREWEKRRLRWRSREHSVWITDEFSLRQIPFRQTSRDLQCTTHRPESLSIGAVRQTAIFFLRMRSTEPLRRHSRLCSRQWRSGVSPLTARLTLFRIRLSASRRRTRSEHPEHRHFRSPRWTVSWCVSRSVIRRMRIS